jgi:YqjK-like protein
MNTRLAEITHRRAMLVDQAAARRDELSRAIHSWRVPLAFVGRGIAFVRTLRRFPLAVALGAALLGRTVLLKRHVWVKRILVAWQIYRGLGRRRSAEIS